MAKKKYTVTYERDEDGWWVAHVKGVKGCHTQGKNIAQARKRIRECLGLFIGNTADSVVLVDEVKLPPDARRILDQIRKSMKMLDEVGKTHRELMRKFAKGVTKKGYSLQDAGELLDVSRQRVHQILNT